MSVRRRRLGAYYAVALLTSMACACASAPPPAEAPPAAPAPAPESQATFSAPMDVDATAAELDRAEGDLQRALALATTPSAKAEPDKKKTAEEEKESALSGGTGDPCQSACSALDSMQRSAAHLCGLTGDADSRCEAAKARVTRASERVRNSCRACAR